MNYFEALRLTLSADGAAAKLRRDALASVEWSPSPTAGVAYTAANRLLLIADAETAARIAARMPEKMLVYAAIPAKKNGSGDAPNFHFCADLSLRGHLGRFRAQAGGEDLAEIFRIESGVFDHALDCGAKPLIQAELKPPGYRHAPNAAAQDAAAREIPEWIGEFEKPKYFEYDADICAHSRSGIAGCTRCIDACPAEAITSSGEGIAVDPHLCQGAGACASACPSGAIRYAYPRVHEQIDMLRTAIGHWRRGEKTHGAEVLFFDSGRGREALEKIAPALDARIFPVAVEEIGAAGLDLIAPALAYGAARAWLLAPPETPKKEVATLKHNLAVLHAVMKQCGEDATRAAVVESADEILKSAPMPPPARAATFAAAGDKRAIIRAALSFFAECAEPPPEAAALPQGAMFGHVQVDENACTLCMGCVAVCPANALQAGGDTPALKLIEANCVQCGICARACPESALTLEARLHFDAAFARAPRALKEEEAFRCIRCDKPFATASMIGRMREKLKGHWMFATPEAARRLRMCEDCRVLDMLEHENRASAAKPPENG